MTGAVEVCARWAQFEYFLADMGRRPRGTTLVRIDENEAHGPRNSQWEACKPLRDAIVLATPRGARAADQGSAGRWTHELRDRGAVGRFSHSRTRRAPRLRRQSRVGLL